MDSQMSAAVEIIDQRIAKLKQIKVMLLQEFGSGEAVEAPKQPEPDQQPPKQAKTYGDRPARKEQVIAAFREHGPMHRREIIENTGIPMGTVSYLMNDKDTFVKMEDGRWGLVAWQQKSKDDEEKATALLRKFGPRSMQEGPVKFPA